MVLYVFIERAVDQVAESKRQLSAGSPSEQQKDEDKSRAQLSSFFTIFQEHAKIVCYAILLASMQQNALELSEEHQSVHCSIVVHHQPIQETPL